MAGAVVSHHQREGGSQHPLSHTDPPTTGGRLRSPAGCAVPPVGCSAQRLPCVTSQMRDQQLRRCQRREESVLVQNKGGHLPRGLKEGRALGRPLPRSALRS